jgi:hypothetical protein
VTRVGKRFGKVLDEEGGGGKSHLMESSKNSGKSAKWEEVS